MSRYQLEVRRIGVLALQGDFAEHVRVMTGLGASASEVRHVADLEGLDGLIIPGGESTTIGLLMERYALIAPICRLANEGMPIWGTCAGLILMARDVGRKQPLLELLDISVERNAFGRQLESFETDLDVQGLDGGKFRAVFIRAPVITTVGSGVKVLSRLEDNSIVAVQDGHLLGTAFHPELTQDDRLHSHFLSMTSSS